MEYWPSSRDTTITIRNDLRLLGPFDHSPPPPSYGDAIKDLPPEYSAIAPVAQQRDLIRATGPERRESPKTRSSHRIIDLESPSGIREHKGKKKKGAGAKNTAPPPANDPPPPPPPEDSGEKQDEGAGNDGGGGNGDDDNNGGDGGGGGDDDWGDAWGTATSKKKKQKKKEEEEEQKLKEEEERLKKEEEERQAKEEEERIAREEAERKAAEEVAAAESNGLSWADEADGNDDWAGVTVGKKKKKKGKVRYFPPRFIGIVC